MSKSVIWVLLVWWLGAAGLSAQSLIPDLVWSSVGQAGQIATVALSPDEQVVASAGSEYGSSESSIKLSRFSDGHLLRTLTGHANTVSSVVFASNGQLLFSASYDRTIRVWEVSSGLAIRTWSEDAGIASIARSPDDRLIAAGSGTSGYPHLFDGKVRLWDASNGALVQTLTNNVAAVFSVAFSPDGRLIAGACVNGAAFVWEVESGRLVWSLPGGTGGWTGSVTFSPDGQKLAYGFGSGWSYVGVRRVSDGTLLWQQTAHQNNVNDLAFSRDGNLLVSAGSRNYYGAGVETTYPTIMLWNALTGTRSGIVPSGSASVGSLAVLSNGTQLLTGEGINYGANITSLRVWQTNGSLVRDWNGHSGIVTALAFSPEGDILASGAGSDRRVKLWHSASGSLLHTLEGHTGAASAIAFSPDGTKVVYADDAIVGEINLFRVDNGNLVWSRSMYPERVLAIAFSPFGERIAVGRSSYGSSPYSIAFFNEADGAMSQPISGLATSIVALAWLPSNQVVSLTANGAVTFWNTNGVVVRSFQARAGAVCGAVSPDGDALAVGYINREIDLVRLADGSLQRTFRGHSNPPTKVGLSADGAMLFSVATKELFLWRVFDGALLGSRTEEIGSPASLAVSARGDAFALGRADAVILVARKPDFFLPLAQPESGNLSLKFSGVKGMKYSIETSADLQSWTPWTNVYCSGLIESFDAPVSASTNRLYRLTRSEKE